VALKRVPDQVRILFSSGQSNSSHDYRHVDQAIGLIPECWDIKIATTDGDSFTLHSLRYTYITHLLANGVDAPTVMEYSGHKSYRSFSVYLHKTDLGEERACLIP
jgi:integrase